MRLRSPGNITKYRYSHGLRRGGTPHNPKTLNLGLELLCHACPFGALLLDSSYRIIFANREGTDLLVRWNDSREHIASVAGSHVPREIIAACDRLRWGTTEGANPVGRPHFGGRVFVAHPATKDLSAVVALERSPRDRRLALFCIFLHDRLKENLVSGRRDQLAMLTVAERRVAKLAVEGLRNREIAAALGKSVTTVKTQLVAVFGKLQVESRVQLAALLRSF